ncbi:hypothetical protein [Pseudoalteromonas sp. MMG024]|uniref:hypothetical protein n=1 Tax=Pseudoalteromonas sp. MMG024 TaxID=2909980 RepID=UPI001F246BE8|nr:hypothetical protein [Pseudoalteromonas sp. MMG024]MCF6455725.1 hypothetical protein [Pseudoalteromonas sp. MMG024]
MDCKFTLTKIAFCLALLGVSLTGIAHDTNTTHPRITHIIGESIKTLDKTDGAYYQLYQQHPAYEIKHFGEAQQKSELGKLYPYLWGFDPLFPNKDQKDIDEDAGTIFSKKTPYKAFRKPSLDVLDGVVMEDEPANRVMSHFQHAYSGMPMNVSDWVIGATGAVHDFYGFIEPSEIAAGRFFNDAITTMGYLNTIDDLVEMDPQGDWSIKHHGKQLSGAKAMWLFGHALHHAEDMSSIAHVHGDAHLTVFTHAKDYQLHGEPDDYEAHFIPSKIYEFIGGIADPWFRAVPHAKLVTSAGQLWGRSSDPSVVSGLTDLLDPNVMSRGIYNVPLFQGHLPTWFKIQIIDDSYSKPIRASEIGKKWLTDVEATLASYEAAGMLCGQGELSKMFYFGDLADYVSEEGPKLTQCGLRLNLKSRRKLPHYEILHAAAKHREGSGDYPAHRVRLRGSFNSLFADWWEASAMGGPEDFYYIEQTMKGMVYEGEEDGKNIAPGEWLLRPNYLRQDITKPFSATNPLVKTCTEYSAAQIRCLKGDSLLERFAEVLIPYSMEFLTGYSQFFYDVANLPPYLQEVTVAQNNRTHYGMKWQGKVNKSGRITMMYEKAQFPLTDNSVKEPFNFIAQRYKAQTIPHLGFLNQNDAITVNLKFNEAIRHPNLANSGFELGLTKMGTDKLFNIDNLTFNVLNDGFSGCVSLSTDVLTTGNCWQVTIPASELAGLFADGLNGRITLLVKAADLNNHRDKTGKPTEDVMLGSLLDSTPATPARRYVTKTGPSYLIYAGEEGSIYSRENEYFWHTTESVPGDMFGDLKDKVGAFAYEPGFDRNHVLLFDSTKPEIRLEATKGAFTPESKEGTNSGTD